ncbi:MAG TPA: hypothetical protein VNT53_06065 [Pseudolysinimonas sp.]|nr:hypothetical protein [Pseudolysinimonas sp.]
MIDDDTVLNQRAREELDRQEREIRYQLARWQARLADLEAASSHGPGVAREIALFRGRVSGAQAMLRHYGHQRAELDPS